jgi:3-oxoacyl-[acyl-carrier protein] reductase
MSGDLDFTGRAVLVTGASRGIGRAVAKGFASRGARVAVHFGINARAAEQTLAELAGDGHLVVGADLADAGAVATMVDEAVAGLGGLDVLVNNAGVYTMHPVASVTYEEWQAAWKQSLDVNLVGAANASFCAARHMIRRGRGSRPFGRVATADEVAAAVLFLASDGASFTSGAVVDVNGASYLRT